MKFSELPDTVRVKLTEEGEKELWHRIDEFGGVKGFSDAFGYSSSSLYNWKNKDVFVPVDLVRKVMGNEASEEVVAFKGRGRSRPVSNPVFPIPEDDELLTRVQASVHVNRKGIPVYQADDQGLVNRFTDLLTRIGEVPHKIYSRSLYELRYPKYLHEIFSKMSYEKDFAALVDEKGSVEDGSVNLEDKSVSVDNFERELFHRGKALDLALEREASAEVERLLGEEASKVRSLFR